MSVHGHQCSCFVPCPDLRPFLHACWFSPLGVLGRTPCSLPPHLSPAAAAERCTKDVCLLASWAQLTAQPEWRNLCCCYRCWEGRGNALVLLSWGLGGVPGFLSATERSRRGSFPPPLHTLQCLWILRGFLPNTAGWDFLRQLSVTSVTHLLTVGFGGVVSFSEVLCVVSVVLCHL